jgi:hypothetical protein
MHPQRPRSRYVRTATYGSSIRWIAYREHLDKVDAISMQERIMPVAIPIIKKASIKLIIQAGIAGTDVASQGFRIRVDEEPVDRARRYTDLAVFGGYRGDDAITLNTHDSFLYAKVLCLERMEVKGRTSWAFGAIDEFAEVFGYRTFNVVAIVLTNEGAPAWRRLEDLGGDETAESGTHMSV